MITKIGDCRIFLCYRGSHTENAKGFLGFLARHKNNYGRVWCSDCENQGDFNADIVPLIRSAQFAVIFFSPGFTGGFLDAEGNINHNDFRATQALVNECITAKEILTIEKQRQSGSIKIISANMESYSLSAQDLQILETMFRQAGILREDSLSAWRSLNRNDYGRTNDQEEFFERLAQGLECEGSGLYTRGTTVNEAARDLLLSYTKPHRGRPELLEQFKAYLAAGKHTVCLHAPQGEGKTYFVQHLLSDIQADKRYHLHNIFYWKFLSDHRKEANNIDDFFDAIIRFFGHSSAFSDPASKIDYIVSELSASKTLLILDSVELAIQENTDGSADISHPLLKSLVYQYISSFNVAEGMLLLVSQQPVLENWHNKAFFENIFLPAMRTDECIQIIHDSGLISSLSETTALVRECNKNPYTLTMFCKLIQIKCHGDISQRHAVFDGKPLPANMAGNLAALIGSMLSLCAKEPADALVLQVVCLLKKELPKAELLRQIHANSPEKLAAGDVEAALERLHDMGLIYCGYDTRRNMLTTVNCIPFVRAQVNSQYESRDSQGLGKYHLSLADYYADIFQSKQEAIASFDDLEPAYLVVQHLICAGCLQKALNYFWENIYRKRSFFSQKRFGSYAKDLYIVSLFCEKMEGSDRLEESEKAWLYAVAGYLCNTLGKLEASEQYRLKELDIYRQLPDGEIFLISDGLNFANNLILQCKLEEAEAQFAFIGDRIKGYTQDSLTASNKFSNAFDIRKLRASIYSRHAFLQLILCQLPQARRTLLSGKKEDILKSSTGIFYYYLIRILTAKSPLADMKARLEINALLKQQKGKAHELSYLYFLKALLEKRKPKPNLQKFTEYVELSVSCAQQAWRMDQLPLIVLLCAYACLPVWEKTGSDPIFQKLNTLLDYAEDLLQIYDIPLFHCIALLIKIRLAGLCNNYDAQLSLSNAFEAEPIFRKYFSIPYKHAKNS